MTTWYCQNSSSNINDANNWNDVAAGGGNVLTWASLAAGDILAANGKTAIAVNVDFTCAKISNAAYSGTAGGQFTVTTAAANRGITASVEGQDTGTITANGCLDATLHATNRLTITGNVTGGGGTNAFGMRTGTANGLLTVTGNVTGGSGTNAHAIQSLAAINITVGGTTAGGAGAHGINHTNAGILTGSFVAVTAATGKGINEAASASTAITVTGAVTASATSAAIATIGIVTMGTGSSLVSNSTGWWTPINGRIKWETTDTGMTITLYDAGGAAHVLKKPDYPADGTVADGTQFDYTPDKGTRVDCPVAQAQYTGTPYYGNPSSLVDGTLYGPNLDSNPGVTTADAVLTTAHFGVNNATQGSAAGGGGRPEFRGANL